VLRFGARPRARRLATLILLWVIKLLIYLSLETQRALVFGRGVCERQIPKVGIRRSFGYVGDDPLIGGIACFEIR